MISTTGFSFYTHKCAHHNTSTIVVSKDDCCNIAEPVVAEEESCCTVENIQETISGCGSDVNESSCCETDLNYYRLSEWFLESERNDDAVNYSPTQIEVLHNMLDETIQINPPVENLTLVQKIPKRPLYRLLSQSKSDPPLI